MDTINAPLHYLCENKHKHGVKIAQNGNHDRHSTIDKSAVGRFCQVALTNRVTKHAAWPWLGLGEIIQTSLKNLKKL